MLNMILEFKNGIIAMLITMVVTIIIAYFFLRDDSGDGNNGRG